VATKDPRDSNRRVDFPEAGQGYSLLLRNSGIRTLRAVYGQDHIQTVERAFLTLDVPVIEKLLEFMVWNGGDKPVLKTLDDFDDFPLEVLIDKLRDAWMLAINGRKYMEQVEFIREEAKKLTDGAPLTGSPETGGSTSSEQPSGLDSSHASSTL
jgi:hypothetical protein